MNSKNFSKKPKVRHFRVAKSKGAWQIENLNNQATVHFRVVDENIINRMPEATETFVERGVIRSLVNRMRKFVETGG